MIYLKPIKNKSDIDPDRLFKVPSISSLSRQQIYAKTLKNMVKLNKEQNRFM